MKLQETTRSSPRSWKFGEAPGRLPLLGHALTLRRRPLPFLASLASYGDLVELRFGPRRAYVVCHPELAHQVLVDTRTFDKGGPWFDKVRPIVGDGLGTVNWSVNRRQRKTTQPAFRPAQITAYAPVMLDEIRRMIASWRPGQAFDIGDAMYGLTVRILVRALFSSGIAEESVAQIQQSFPHVSLGIWQRMIAPVGLLEKLPTPAKRRFDRSRGRINAIIEEILREHQEAKPGSEQGDLLSTLRSAVDERTGGPLTELEIRDQVIHFLAAGTESTAAALAWVFYLIGELPDVEQRLQAEIDGVLQGRPPCFDDLPQLDYTRRVLNESLRMYPPGWLISRITTSRVELAGRSLPAGTTVLYSPYTVQRDPRVFPAPDRFDPDRWLPAQAKAVPRGSMIPFAMGSRQCIGETYARSEIVLAIAAIVSGWQLRPAPGTQLKPEPRLSLGTGPLLMVPEARKAAATVS